MPIHKSEDFRILWGEVGPEIPKEKTRILICPSPRGFPIANTWALNDFVENKIFFLKYLIAKCDFRPGLFAL